MKKSIKPERVEDEEDSLKTGQTKFMFMNTQLTQHANDGRGKNSPKRQIEIF